MAYSFLLDRVMNPYDVARNLTYDPGTRNILIVADAPNTAVPVEYFSIRPFLWFSPGVGSLGFTDFFYGYTPMYRNRMLLRLNFPERWGVEFMRLPNPDNTPMRIRAWWE